MANDFVTHLKMNSSQFDSSLARSTRQIHNFQNNINRTGQGLQRGFGNMARTIAPLNMNLGAMATKLGVIGVAAAGVGKVFGDNIKYNRDLDDSLSALQAITGDSTKEMEKFRDAAIELGMTTPQTAGQVADAFKTVAQMKPDLVASKQALIDVTEASLNLANAQGTDVATAADIVTRALNVYGASARQAERFTNVLAAGMRNGSGDIEWLGNAFGKAGATVRAVGMSYEETIATLEILSSRIKDSTSAGAQLRNVLLYLEKTNDDNLKPSVVGVAKAFQNLRDRQYSLVELQNLFKKQNIEAATTLIDNADALQTMTEKITNTNTATEMANTRTENLTGALNRLDSAWQSLILSMGNSNGILKSIIDNFATLINRINGVTETTQKFKKEANTRADQEVEVRVRKYIDQGMSDADIDKQVRQDIAAWEKQVQEKLDNTNKQIKAKGNKAPDYLFLNREVLESQLNAAKSAYDKIGDVIKDVRAEASKGSTDEIEIAGLIDDENASIDELNAKIKELKKLRDAANDPAQIIKYNAQIAELTQRINTLKNDTGDNSPFGSIAYWSDQLSEANKKFQNATTSAERQVIQQEIDYLKWLIEQLQNVGSKTIANPLVQSPTDNAVGVAKRDKSNFSTKTLKADFKKYDFKDTNNDLQEMNELLGLSQQLIGGIGDSFEAAGDSVAATMAEMIRAIIPVISAVAQLVIAEGTEKAVATSKHWLEAGVAIASLTATILGALAQKDRFATGGIVDGNEYSGDRRLVRVNSGEMILNKQQQANLFHMISEGWGIGSASNGKVTFRIQGRELVGVLNNYNNKLNKIS